MMNFKNNEENCEEPVCFSNPDSVKTFYKSDNLQNILNTEEKNSETLNTQKNNFLKSNSLKKKKNPKQKLVENSDKKKNLQNCPLTRELLGHFSWSLLHTMSFNYPKHPTIKEKKLMKNFLNGFAKFYPCKICSTHFQRDIRELPPKLDSKKDFVLWTCGIHNLVF